ncbi:hypothetical protein niasHT_025520 [Heterodera trifolii]|uniref:Hydroxylysine kinase n=1 Tax=Heterodera trifolii TaxID=157864 RepID=A0ABD2J8Q9_9BILA
MYKSIAKSDDELQRKSPEGANFVCRIDRTFVLAKDYWTTVIGELCATFYGIQPAQITQLTGYDDINFKLSKCAFLDGNLCQTQLLTLKFVNHWEAKFFPKLCEARADLAQLVANVGIKCPQRIKTFDGLLYVDYPSTNCPNEANNVHLVGTDGLTTANGGIFGHQMPIPPVVLREFVPGTPLGDWVVSTPTATRTFIDRVDTFCEQIGTMLGTFHAACDRYNFCPPVLRQYAPIMALEHWHFHWREFELQKRTDKLDAKMAKQCAEVFEQFEQKVLGRRSEFEQGVVHGDFNESNILVDDEAKVCALIDFGDAHCSFRILDLANAIVYLYMLWAELVPSAGQTDLNRLANCLSRAYAASLGHTLAPNDMAHLALFVRARLVLSLINGLRTQRLASQSGPNEMEYVLKQQKMVQKVLGELSNCNDQSMLLTCASDDD